MKKPELFLKEGVMSSRRLQQLAGILKESVDPETEAKAQEVVANWLAQGGQNQIDDSIYEELVQYFKQGKDLDSDGESVYSLAPESDKFINGEELFDRFIEDLTASAEGILDDEFLAGEASPEAYETFYKVLEAAAKTNFENLVKDAKAEVAESEDSQADPYAYHGVRRRDF